MYNAKINWNTEGIEIDKYIDKLWCAWEGMIIFYIPKYLTFSVALTLRTLSKNGAISNLEYSEYDWCVNNIL